MRLLISRMTRNDDITRSKDNSQPSTEHSLRLVALHESLDPSSLAQPLHMYNQKFKSISNSVMFRILVFTSL